MQSPFDLDNHWPICAGAITSWHTPSPTPSELIVEIRDPRALTKAEHAALLERCQRSNMVIYATRSKRLMKPS